jgi:hypothetical protein
MREFRTVVLASMADAFAVLDRVGGEMFGVTFVKRDGSTRNMVARKGVTAHLAGGDLKYEPRPRGLLPVYDMNARGYRMVNVGTLQEVRHRGTRYVRGWS